MNDERAALESLINAFRLSSLISLAAKLGVADHLATSPKTAGELARLTSCHEDSLYRVLRTLAGIGIFAETEGRYFHLTPLASWLRGDVDGSLKAAAEVVGEEWTWRPWGALLHSVRTGETAFDHLYGQSTWDWFGENPAAAALFNQHMDVRTQTHARAILDSFDFSKMRTIADVGGGQGSLIAAILRRYPNATGAVVNLPHVIQSASRNGFDDVAHRLEFVAGNFFEAVPAGYDAYVLKDILHDWNDGHARKILQTCRRAMHEKSVLLIIEHIVCPANLHCAAKAIDMQMLVRTGGRNRTQEEFLEFFRQTGFGLCSLVRPNGGPDLLAARPCNDAV